MEDTFLSFCKNYKKKQNKTKTRKKGKTMKNFNFWEYHNLYSQGYVFFSYIFLPKIFF